MTIANPVHGDPDAAARRELERLFHIESLLSRGPFSAVYLARDTETEQLVALKTILRLPALDAAVADRFQREAGRAAMLDHPHIVPVYRSGVSPTLLWYSMEFYRGRSLAEVRRGSGGAPLNVRTCLHMVQQIAGALDYAHRCGVTHGNLKPANILIDGNGWTRVVDFAMLPALGGIAALLAGEWPEGALDHLAPEQLAPGNAVGPGSDQYSLAVVTYECLAGRPPFGAKSVEDLVGRRRAGPQPGVSAVRPDVPAHLGHAVQRAMSEVPSRRFASILDFAALLAGGWAAPAVPPSSPAPGSAHRPWSRRVLMVDQEPLDGDEARRARPRRPPWLRLLVWAGIALSVLGAGVTVWVVTRTPRSPPSVVRRLPAPWEPAPSKLPPPALPPSAATESTDRPVARPSAAPGRLVVSAKPWADLYVDDRPVGNTPVVDLPISAGAHRLRLVRDGFEPHERVVQVLPGQTLRITGIVLQVLRP